MSATWLLATAVVAALGVLYVSRLLADPSVHLLVPEGGAGWIRFNAPIYLKARGEPEPIKVFRKRFAVDVVPDEARLVVRGFKVVFPMLDGAEIGEQRLQATRWKEPIEIDLAPILRPGQHELRFGVMNVYGHAALLAYCPALGLATGPDWEVSRDGGKSWSPALPVDKPVAAEISRSLPSASVAFAARFPFFLSLFVMVFAWTIARSGRSGACPAFPTSSAARLRWVLLAAWAVLAANDIGKLPPGVGFDVAGHLEYIRYVAERARLPLASEGWQMFQTPLYYIVSAPIYLVFSGLVGAESMGRILRVVPLLCGALQVEIAYRALRSVFPERSDLQAIGVWICGLLPMNLYMSQAVSNEPFAGVLTALTVLLCLQGLVHPPSRPLRHALGLGLTLGLALLAKATAVLLIPLVAVAVTVSRSGHHRSGGRLATSALASLTATLGVASLVAGWYYVRNWIVFGKPFVGGWDQARGIVWWQDPSYRIPEHFTRFGEVLFYPVYAGVQGFWDALYSSLWLDGFLSGLLVRPPWNANFMQAGAWLALPVTAAILVGMVWPLFGRARRAQLFATGAVLLYLAALLHVYLILPTHAAVKASYTIGLTPCYGLLATAGFRPLLGNRWLRAAVYGLLACFGAAAYAAYFVL